MLFCGLGMVLFLFGAAGLDGPQWTSAFAVMLTGAAVIAIPFIVRRARKWTAS